MIIINALQEMQSSSRTNTIKTLVTVCVVSGMGCLLLEHRGVEYNVAVVQAITQDYTASVIGLSIKILNRNEVKKHLVRLA
ncbi:MAG: hypothetical protein V3T17_18430 [Pseudomonadales bacterium]